MKKMWIKGIQRSFGMTFGWETEVLQQRIRDLDLNKHGYIKGRKI